MGRNGIFFFLSLWVSVAFGRRSCPQETLSVFASVPPCHERNDGDSGALSCDFFVSAAAQLAAEHLNQQSSLLANINVTIKVLDGSVVALLEAVGALADGEIHGVIGPNSIRNSHLFAPVITNRFQVPSVAYSVSEEDIVSSGLYHRTLPSNTYITNALVSLLDHFQWYMIAVLSSGSEEYLQELERFTMAFSEHLDSLSNGLVDLDHIHTFSTEEEMERSIKHFATTNIKTFVAFVEPGDAVKMICWASRVSLTGSGYVWILPAYTDPNWWRKLQNVSNCTEEELQTALESTLFFVPNKYPPFTQEDLVKVHHPRKFRQELLDVTTSIFNLSETSDISGFLTHSHATSAYDAVWTIATAWDTVLTRLDCEDNFDNVTNKLQLALEEISECEFKHLWGHEGCSLAHSGQTESQSYYGQVVITQFQGGYVCPVALALPHTQPGRENNIVLMKDTEDHLCPTVNQLGQWIRNFTNTSAVNCTFEFQWKGESAPPPSGYTVVDSKISLAGLASISVLIVVLMALVISIAIFNLSHRENKFIKATSPRVSMGITAALLLLLPGPLLIGLVSSTRAYNLSGSLADRICWFDIWLPIFGFTLLYGTLLAKNYRIYRIFYNKKLKIRQDEGLTDSALMLAVLLLLLPVVALCIASSLGDDTGHNEYIVSQDKDDSTHRFIRISYCKKFNGVTFTLAAGYFHLLFIPVIILAFLTMRLKSRFGMEGKSTLGTMTSILVFMEIFITLYTIFDIEDSPKRYILLFYLFAFYIFSQVATILAFIYTPLYYNMYKEHRKKVLQASMSVEAAEDCQRLEHYRELQSQALDLRRRLSEIDQKLIELRTKTKDEQKT